MNSKEQITVVINETDLISREYNDCENCALACAIQRKTGMFPKVGSSWVNIYKTKNDRDGGVNRTHYSLEPEFNQANYDELRKVAMNHQKVFHTITLIPV